MAVFGSITARIDGSDHFAWDRYRFWFKIEHSIWIHNFLFIIITFCLAGCATSVAPPKVQQGGAAIFLLDHGRHSSLVLSGPNGHIVRYSYGDWAYYALGETGPYRGTAALCWPTQGALGRRELPGPPTVPAVKNQVVVPIVHIYPLAVERSKIASS
jgi:hypothetical protein